ncbi:hypothetical protein D3C73_1626300 [compost metagenome]
MKHQVIIQQIQLLPNLFLRQEMSHRLLVKGTKQLGAGLHYLLNGLPRTGFTHQTQLHVSESLRRL